MGVLVTADELAALLAEPGREGVGVRGDDHVQVVDMLGARRAGGQLHQAGQLRACVGLGRCPAGRVPALELGQQKAQHPRLERVEP